jgi:hypothetical protein
MLKSANYDISHVVVRLIVAVNLIELALEIWFSPYSQMIVRMNLDGPIFIWDVASSFILPLYVGLAWLIRKIMRPDQALREREAFLLDLTLALIWFLAPWIAGIYVVTHRGAL